MKILLKYHIFIYYSVKQINTASSEYDVSQLFDVDDCDLVRLILQLLICAFRSDVHSELRHERSILTPT